ncbi:MAG: 2-oxoacid:acceptor oxidoreductase subunit alpha [Minisyncoccia bacterium]|jgi:2-oxoglutarate ferredoxin oxidoreductase subunit alpha
MEEPRRLHKEIHTVLIGGAAGDGVREAGLSLGELLIGFGYEIYSSFDYPSLIRGGHNVSRTSFSREKITSDYSTLDTLIALNEETVALHMGELAENSVVFAENFSNDDKEKLGERAMELPMSAFVQEIKALPIMRSSVALGALCYLLDLPFETMNERLDALFKEKSYEANITLAKMGYAFMEKRQSKHPAQLQRGEISAAKEFIDGNTAFAHGLISGGLHFYVAYPMTPASSILHYLAAHQKNFNIKVIQPEGELAVINMALGMAYAGKRTAIGTSGGGFALMQEAFSLAGMTELPLVVAVSQRQAPATGSPTHTSQSDLQFAMHSGHGEFPRIVLAPGDPEEAFEYGATALNLAWKYQLPVIVLLDKQLSEGASTAVLHPDKITIENGNILNEINGHYERYAITENGISPMAFPGTPDAAIKVDSYEHDENGITSGDPKIVKAMGDKRFAKAAVIKKEMGKSAAVKVYGDPESKNVIVFWGSTKGAVLEAAKYVDKPLKLVQVVWLVPFDKERVAKELGGAEKIIDVEANRMAQLASLIREKTGIEIHKKILRYDSLPFNVIGLAEEINAALM